MTDQMQPPVDGNYIERYSIWCRRCHNLQLAVKAKIQTTQRPRHRCYCGCRLDPPIAVPHPIRHPFRWA